MLSEKQEIVDVEQLEKATEPTGSGAVSHEELADGGDEILKLEDINPDDERRLVARLDRRILPIICLAYLFECAFTFDTILSFCFTDRPFAWPTKFWTDRT